MQKIWRPELERISQNIKSNIFAAAKRGENRRGIDRCVKFAPSIRNKDRCIKESRSKGGNISINWIGSELSALVVDDSARFVELFVIGSELESATSGKAGSTINRKLNKDRF